LRSTAVMADADRKAELLKKKQRLEELRRSREERASRRKEQRASMPEDQDVSRLVEQLLADAPSAPAPRSETSHEAPPASTPSRTAPSVARLRMRTSVNTSLASTEVRHEDVAPQEVISYTKGAQTDPMPELERPRQVDEPEEDEDEGVTKTAPEETTAAPQEAEEEAEPEPELPKEMSSEEAAHVINTGEFQSFFDNATRLVERVLNVRYDPLVDYGASEEVEHDVAPGESVRLNCSFFDKRWSTGRTVTCMDWSAKHPELLAVGYNDNPDAVHDPDGIVMVWNTHMTTRPEYVFECQSAVLSCKFAPFQPNIVVGGTYSGQIVLWDNRAKRTPVQRSNLGTQAHTHPVYCMDIVGTQNAHNLITISTDGKLCSWSLDMLNEPQEEPMDLNMGASRSVAVAATCMSFPAGDINNFIVGSEEGVVYQASRHGAKAGVNPDGYQVEGYIGPVTGVDFHPAMGSGEFSHLYLTSSTDWTVKLWSLRDKQRRPVHIFDYFDDYVYDVQWSPIHPGLFVSADGTGQLNFWNLNADIEVPYASVEVGEGNTALNKARWNPQGNAIAVGDATGKVHIYDVGERLANPRSDEASRLRESLNDIETARAEAERAGQLS